MDEKLLKLISGLIEISGVDTVYRDVYLQRVRHLIAKELPRESYLEFTKEQELVLYLNQKIRSAMNEEDWNKVKELSERMLIVQKKLETNHTLIRHGKSIYDFPGIAIDEFSPGLQSFAAAKSSDLAAIKKDISQKLAETEKEDPSMKNFYRTRKTAFEGISIRIPKKDQSIFSGMTPDQIHDEALRALNKGDMERLEKLADSFIKKSSGSKGSSQEGLFVTGDESKIPDRFYKFEESTLEKAKNLGLSAEHVDAEREYAKIYRRFAWHPMVGEEDKVHAGGAQVTHIPIDEDIPEPMKHRIELHALHPFINSGGARYLPDMVEEDFLVEEFPDPSQGEQPPMTGLLSALGFEKRRGLARIQIEKALFDHGPEIIKELGLEVEDFCLICIPADLHLRLGQRLGWGNQKVWTHFDGYKVMKEGKFMALAGGDVQFGGVYDLVTIGREYESDRVIARFAVIQRKRMEAWR
jgi:hypothetical protein